MRHQAGIAVCVGVMWSVSPTFAQTMDEPGRAVQISSAGTKSTIDCEGRAVQITGATNELTLNGTCPSVEITGAGNTVRIEIAGRIKVAGAANRVTWERAIDPDTRKPRVSITGAGSAVLRAPGASTPAPAPKDGAVESGSPAPGTPSPDNPPLARVQRGSARGDASSVDGSRLTVLVSGTEETVECDSREVTVVGNGNRLTLRGDCPLVRVTGSDNTVTVERVGRILTTGNKNTVTWTRALTGGAPSQTNTGTGNVIRQGAR